MTRRTSRSGSTRPPRRLLIRACESFVKSWTFVYPNKDCLSYCSGISFVELRTSEFAQSRKSPFRMLTKRCIAAGGLSVPLELPPVLPTLAQPVGQRVSTIMEPFDRVNRAAVWVAPRRIVLPSI